ncbi:MAG: amino acid permease [Bacillota bacterium]|jgi:arginine/ornithine permease
MSSQPEQLKRAMTSRHMMMISIGAIIGTGLFLNTGYTIGAAGPGGTILSYIFGAFIMWMVMVCLGELSIAMPESGSFQEFSHRLISPAAGHAIGWLYWFCWVLCIAWYLSAVGIYMQYWMPNIPPQVWYLIFGVVLFIFNSLSSNDFGEGQFWFAGMKVIAIVVFALIALAAAFGLIGGGTIPGMNNLVAHQGFFPFSIFAILPVMISVAFSYQGCEIVGNTAGESVDPQKEMPKAIRSTIFQVTGVYVFSVIMLMVIVPWTELGLSESPFVTALARIGIPGADHVMNLIVIISALSAANSAIYCCTRFVYGLSLRGSAPKSLIKLNKRQIPLNSLILTYVGIIICILTGEIPLLANTLNAWMWAVSAVIGVLAWIVIAVCLIAFRRKLKREGKSVDELAYRSPGYPLVPILVIVLNLIIIFSMLFDEGQRLNFYIGVPIIVLTYLFFIFYERSKKSASRDDSIKA